ncbi:hypothetical protein M569_04809 [Genlisea aurea]|uniref:Glycosyl transferase CAP10 domain-containing protein n=1 Tax=Genlisea aurea TaxID=192259 RepID=S8EBN8_9LAMI|nr:hypothetical protein M569_04809 [Genlisea aurea]
MGTSATWWRRVRTASTAGAAASSSASGSSKPQVLFAWKCVVVCMVCFVFVASWTDLSKHGSESLQYAMQYMPLLAGGVRSVDSRPEFPLDCDAWRSAGTCPRNLSSWSPPSWPSPSRSTCPEYFRWIHEDLRHWKDSGISKDAVEKAKDLANFRVVILDGRVYVEELRGCFQTRVLFTIWGIVQLSRVYPNRLPNVEFMFHCEDKPVVKKADHQPGSGPPLFRYSSANDSLDIVFPDWDFWGWVEVNIKPWKKILEEIREENMKTKWEEREPYAFWRGNPDVGAVRRELMACAPTPERDWNARLYTHDWGIERGNGFQNSDLARQCTHRYKIYIEGIGWSVSNKYIMACNSPAFVITPKWFDFFTRGLTPRRDYWPIRDSDKCRSIKFGVEWGNNHTEEAKAIGERGHAYMYNGVRMEHVYDYMYHLLNEYAKLMTYKPSPPAAGREICAESLACFESGTVRRFMDESLETLPADSSPCELPPPYEDQQLQEIIAGKARSIAEVEKWEDEYSATRRSS